MSALDAASPLKPVRCSARSSQTGQPCKNFAMHGSTVCKSHGGRAPQVKAAAARRVALGEAVAELDKLGRPHEVDPADAMLEMVYEAAGNVAVYRRLIQSLQHPIVDEGRVSDDGRPASGLGDAIAGRVDPENWKAAPHVWVSMYDAERERLVRWAKACRDAGVDERRVQLAEAQGERMVSITERAFAAFMASLVAAGVAAELLERVRRDDLPQIMRSVVEATSRDDG